MARMDWMRTARIGFSTWSQADLPLAQQLWGEPEVTRYLCKDGRMTPLQIQQRLCEEIARQQAYGVQYWPIFSLADGELIGCCGLRPTQQSERMELGFHLRSAYWGQGLAYEAARAVMRHAFTTMHLSALWAGHHPQNTASQRLLLRLQFVPVGTQFYAPTGLQHPSYLCKRADWSTGE